MLAVFEKKVVNGSSTQNTSDSAQSVSMSTHESLTSHFASIHPGFVTINLEPYGFLAYSLHDQDPLLPRVFSQKDGVSCFFQGHINQIPCLQRKYGIRVTDEAKIVIEIYEKIRDGGGPDSADSFIRYIDGKFAFIGFDESKKSLFVVAHGEGSQPFFWGTTDNEGSHVFSDDIEIVKAGCGKACAPFPIGCLFTSVRKSDHELDEVTVIPTDE